VDIANGWTYEDYRDAFERHDASWKLDGVVTDPADLPIEIRDNVPEPDAMVAFHFSAYVEQFDDTVRMWIPIKRDELVEKLNPDALASISKPLLKESLERTVAHRQAQIDAEEVSDADAHNPG
jgi:hypothetical protein